jgi:magnesium chelatase family protein
LPDAAVKESRERVMTALTNSGFNFTFGRTTINLAPADVKKEGPSFDLPIAIGMVAASEQFETEQRENFIGLRRGQRPGERQAGDGDCRRQWPHYAHVILNPPVPGKGAQAVVFE